jgi:hypothetical protein
MFRRYPRGIITANALTGTSGVYDISERFQVPRPYSADLLIIAGGASGGGTAGGGGGAGGYLTFSGQSFTPGDVKTVTVGAGGASVFNTNGNNGVNSSVTGLTTAVGGGGGRLGDTGNGAGLSGGSGGGATGSVRINVHQVDCTYEPRNRSHSCCGRRYANEIADSEGSP